MILFYRKVRITVDVPLVDRPIYNVIGTIFGDTEPGLFQVFRPFISCIVTDRTRVSSQGSSYQMPGRQSIKPNKLQLQTMHRIYI